MKRQLSLYITFIFVLLAAISCKKSERQVPVAPKPYYQYFPLKAGSWKIYQMDSVNIYRGDDSMHYYMKEIVTNSFTDNSGQPAYRIEQWVKKDSFDVWHISKVYTSKLTPQEAVVTVDAIPYVRLTFPVSANTRWNTHKYNNYFGSIPPSYLNDDYHKAQYLAIHQPYTLNGMHFDSTVLVRSYRDSTAIPSRAGFYERYAAGVGLIELDHDSIEWQHNTRWRGYIIYQKLLQYGN